MNYLQQSAPRSAEFRAKSAVLDQLVDARVKSDRPDTWRILDGIVDIERYCKAKYRIMWILKEPYDHGDGTGGGWDLRGVLKSIGGIHEMGKSAMTWRNVTHASWGILNDFCQWNDMADVDDSPEMLEALKSIAFMNIRKLPGYTSSQYKVIERAYADYKGILHKQLEDYDPDVVIAGSTIYHFNDHLGLHSSGWKANGSVNYIERQGKLFIDAYHPAQRCSTTGVSREQYCNDLINTVKQWADRRLTFNRGDLQEA